MDCLGKAAGLLFVLFILALGSMGGSHKTGGQATGGNSGDILGMISLSIIIIFVLLAAFLHVKQWWKNRRR